MQLDCGLFVIFIQRIKHARTLAASLYWAGILSYRRCNIASYIWCIWPSDTHLHCIRPPPIPPCEPTPGLTRVSWSVDHWLNAKRLFRHSKFCTCLCSCRRFLPAWLKNDGIVSSPAGPPYSIHSIFHCHPYTHILHAKCDWTFVVVITDILPCGKSPGRLS